MRAVVQRVTQASVTVDGEVVGRIGPGLAVLVGAGPEDGEPEARLLADKIANLRIFEDQAGKMNLSVLDTGGEVLAVSQFTLYADTRKGRRPSFTGAALPARGRTADRILLPPPGVTGPACGHRTLRRHDAGGDPQRRARDHHPGHRRLEAAAGLTGPTAQPERRVALPA